MTEETFRTGLSCLPWDYRDQLITININNHLNVKDNENNKHRRAKIAHDLQ